MSENNCDPCKRIGDVVKATCWCQECNELLCKSCLENFHKRLKDTRRHTVTNVSDNQKMARMALCNADEPCMGHKGKMYEVFCLDHSKLCCVLCLAVHHRNCENVQTIDEIVDKTGPKMYELTVLDDLVFLDEEIQKLISSRKGQIDAIMKQRDRLIAEREIQIDTVISKLNKMKIELKEEVSNTCLLETKPFEKQIEEFSWFHRNVLQNIQFLTSIKDLENPKLVFVTLQKFQQSMHLQGNQIGKIAGEIKTVVVDVVLNQECAKLINKREPFFRVTKNYGKELNDLHKLEIPKMLEKLYESFNAAVHSSPAQTNIPRLLTSYKKNTMTKEQSDNPILRPKVAEHAYFNPDISEEGECTEEPFELESEYYIFSNKSESQKT